MNNEFSGFDNRLYIRLLKPFFFQSSPTLGMLYPSLTVHCQFTNLSVSQIENFENYLNTFFADTINATDPIYMACGSSVNLAHPEHVLFNALKKVIHLLQHISGLGVFGPSLLLKATNTGCIFSIPTANIDLNLEKKLYLWLFNGFNLYLSQMNNNATPNVDSVKDLISVINQLRKKKVGSNTNRFIRAAVSLNIPFWRLNSNIIRYGYGQRIKWMESTFSENTSIIGTKIARDKSLANRVLSNAGFPVATQANVVDIKQAKYIAKKMDYPVVLKPKSLDGGIGVFADIRDEVELTAAFDSVKSLRSEVLIEKHIQGKDYRIQILFGKAVWAIHRKPACVIGNGTDTVETLIELANKFRGTSHTTALKPIEINKDLKKSLNGSNYKLSSVLPKGKELVLSSVANVNRGGIPCNVNDIVHPDNLALAEDASKLLRLDFAGVDLILEDISKSWKNTSGIICEVNAQPQFGFTSQQHLYTETLTRLLPNLGRIPVHLVFAGSKTESWVKMLNNSLSKKNIHLSIIKDGDSPINKQLTQQLSRPSTQAILLLISNPLSLSKGINIDKVSSVILDNDTPYSLKLQSKLIVKFSEFNISAKYFSTFEINSGKEQTYKIETQCPEDLAFTLEEAIYNQCLN